MTDPLAIKSFAAASRALRLAASAIDSLRQLTEKLDGIPQVHVAREYGSVLSCTFDNRAYEMEEAQRGMYATLACLRRDLRPAALRRSIETGICCNDEDEAI